MQDEPELISVKTKLTPDLALAKRDSLWEVLVRKTEEVRRHAIWMTQGKSGPLSVCGEKRAALLLRGLCATLPKYELVIWHQDMFDAGKRGAETFVGSSAPSFAGVGPQMWQWDFTCSFAEGHEAFFGLDTPCSYQGLLLTPTVRNQGVPDIGWGVEYDPDRHEVGLTLCVIFIPESPEAAPYPRLRFLPPIYEGDTIPAGFGDVIACHEFMQLPIIAPTDTPPSRATRRRMARENLPTPTVKTIYLRRRALEGDTRQYGSKEWHCSWIVKGHWRRQWYPKKGAHQPVYINPYVKGDTDKPLKTPTESVFVVAR